MKKLLPILILALSFSVSFNALAQDNKQDPKNAHKEKWEKFRQDKHDFYVKTMELTPEQAEKFIPLYDEMEKLKFEATRQVRRESRVIMNADNVTDEQYKEAAEHAAALKEQELKIENEYYTRFCEILTPRQQFLYHRCEPEFQKQMVHKGKPRGDKKPQECK